MSVDEYMQIHVYFYTDMLICYDDKLISSSQQNGCATFYLFDCEICKHPVFYLK